MLIGIDYKGRFKSNHHTITTTTHTKTGKWVIMYMCVGLYQDREVSDHVYVCRPIPRQGCEWSCICVSRGYQFCLFLWVFDWILKLFWQCCICCFLFLFCFFILLSQWLSEESVLDSLSQHNFSLDISCWEQVNSASPTIINFTRWKFSFSFLSIHLHVF